MVAATKDAPRALRREGYPFPYNDEIASDGIAVPSGRLAREVRA
jgi:hypothetical protein